MRMVKTFVSIAETNLALIAHDVIVLTNAWSVMMVSTM